MKVNTKRTCLNSQYGEIYDRLNRSHNSGLVDVDVTIETRIGQVQNSQSGMASTQIINGWLR